MAMMQVGFCSWPKNHIRPSKTNTANNNRNKTNYNNTDKTNNKRKTNHKDPDIHKKCKTDMEKEEIRKGICNLCQSWKRKIQKTYNGRKNNKENSHSKIRNILQV